MRAEIHVYDVRVPPTGGDQAPTPVFCRAWSPADETMCTDIAGHGGAHHHGGLSWRADECADGPARPKDLVAHPDPCRLGGGDAAGPPCSVEGFGWPGWGAIPGI